MNLMTDAEFNARFLEALNRIANSDFETLIRHEARETIGPRMSGLGSCAREQYYAAAGVPETDEVDNAWQTTFGHFGQAFAALVLREMGYTLTHEEVTVGMGPCLSCSAVDENECQCGNYDPVITGHLDGKLTGLDLEDSVAVWDSKFKGVWGMVGTKNSFGMIIDGLPYSDPSIYLQQQSYIQATGSDLAIVTAHPFDISALRTQLSIKKWPEPASPVYRQVLMPDEKAQKLAMQRGKLLVVAIGMGAKGIPAREADPFRDNFPCNYCPWKSRCIADGPEYGLMLPPIPDEMKFPPVEEVVA